MRLLDRTQLLEAPDHSVITRPWEFDVLELTCRWDGGNDGLLLAVLLSKPLGIDPVRLEFSGVTELRLDGFRPLLGLKILDASQFGSQIEAPICVVHYRWKRDEQAEPYFWADAVQRTEL